MRVETAAASVGRADTDPWLDTQRPNIARIQDCLLGGAYHFPIDRVAARDLLRAYPVAGAITRAAADFRARAIRYLLHKGVRQFIDLGAGLPTAGGILAVALSAGHRDVRIVSVDLDPVVVECLRANTRRNVAVVRADLTRPETVLADPHLLDLLDLRQPVGLLTTSVLEFVPDIVDPARVLACYRGALAPGSYWVVSHLTPTPITPSQAGRLHELVSRTNSPWRARSRAAVEELIDQRDCWELVPPGLDDATRWRPAVGGEAPPINLLAGVAVRHS